MKSKIKTLFLKTYGCQMNVFDSERIEESLINFGIKKVDEEHNSDLIILNKNPIDDIRNTNSLYYVIKNGRVYDAETLDEVYPNPRKFGKKSWQESVPITLPGIKSE